MSLLADTHVVLWWLADDDALDDAIKDRLDQETRAFVSAATIWEVAIKHSLGKLPGPPDLPERVRDCGLTVLPVTAEHAITAGRLPLVHRDPFDRMLVAQAECEDLTLITHDDNCLKYGIKTIAV